jgi:hypothetical protein
MQKDPFNTVMSFNQTHHKRIAVEIAKLIDEYLEAQKELGKLKPPGRLKEGYQQNDLSTLQICVKQERPYDSRNCNQSKGTWRVTFRPATQHNKSHSLLKKLYLKMIGYFQPSPSIVSQNSQDLKWLSWMKDDEKLRSALNGGNL